MPKTEKTTCDNCDADLTSTDEMPRFRLHLASEALPHTTNSRFTVLVHPPIEQSCYFCNLKCLREWLEMKR